MYEIIHIHLFQLIIKLFLTQDKKKLINVFKMKRRLFKIPIINNKRLKKKKTK
jgi:hypothetical protein